MKVIGIKRLWYLDAQKAKIEKDAMLTLLKSANVHEVLNTHGETFTYDQGDPTIEEGKNGLSGKTYYRIKKDDGTKTISFTMGEYELSDKALLQGGTVDDGVWGSADTLDFINKAIIGYTLSGDIVVFMNASIIAKTDKQDSVLGLGVQATAMDVDVAGVSDEYWYDGSKLPEALKSFLDKKGE